MPRRFHVTSSSNRESIRLNGLDWTRMGAAAGIAGSRVPEVEGCFLCSEHDIHFFVTMNRTVVPVDVWAVDGIDEEQLVRTSNGFDYLPHAVPAASLTLIKADAVGSRSPGYFTHVSPGEPPSRVRNPWPRPK